MPIPKTNLKRFLKNFILELKLRLKVGGQKRILGASFFENFQNFRYLEKAEHKLWSNMPKMIRNTFPR